jgi:hypothetical protein
MQWLKLNDRSNSDGEHVPPFSPGPMPDWNSHPFSWSVIFFSWYTPLLKIGLKRPLQQDDLWGLRPGQSAADHARPVMGMVKVWDVFRHSALFGMYVRCGVMRLLTELGGMLSPVLLNQLMKWIADKPNAFADSGEHSMVEGYLIATAMFTAAVLTSVSVRKSCVERGNNFVFFEGTFLLCLYACFECSSTHMRVLSQ